MPENNNQSRTSHGENNPADNPDSTSGNAGSDARGGQPQPGQTDGDPNSILIVLLILIVFVIAFLLFAGDTAESPADQPPQETPTEQPADNENTEDEAGSGAQTEGSAAGSVEAN
jgi:hypothetical protein